MFIVTTVDAQMGTVVPGALVRQEVQDMMDGSKVIALQKGTGWSHVQLDEITKVQKFWTEQRENYIAECRVDVYFGRLRDGRFTPVVIMNVYEQGAGTKRVIDDNCDVWENIFTSTTQDEGNEYFRYLLKHGFKVCK